MMKFIVWLSERVFEVLVVSISLTAYSAIAFDHYPDSIMANPFEEFFFIVFAAVLYYLISGYILSCVYFGLMSRENNAIKQAIFMALAFSFHFFVLFFVIFRTSLEEFTLEDFSLIIYLSGVPSVFIANLFGSIILARQVKKNYN